MMVTVHRNAELNELLVLLGRSLLQYASESWPWMRPGEEVARDTVEALADRQKQHAAALVQLLADRGWSIDFGTYPTEFTDLHYMALDYLLAELAAEESALTAEIESLARQSADDAQAAPLVERILADHRDEVRQLAGLARSSRQPAAGAA